MRPAKQLTVRGLCLWSIHIQTCHLWITTRTESIELAIKKARTVIAKEYPSQSIAKVERHGPIDS